MRTSIQACGTATTTLALPKPSGGQELELAVGRLDRLAHQVLAGDAHVRVAGGEQPDDLGGRDEGHFHAVDAVERAAIIAGAAPLHQPQPGAGEEGGGVLLEPALGGYGKDEGRAHATPP